MFEYNCLSANQTRDEIHVKYLSYVLSHYRWLTDVYNVDYYVDKNWEKVPKSWANCIQEFELSDITNLLTTEPKTSFKTVLPLSLLSLRASCSALQLSRKWSPNSEIILPETRFCENNEVLDREVSDSLHPKMKYEILNRNVKQKKRHEIRRLSKLTDHLLKGIADCKTIVDCGSGQGHLSRIMSVCFGYDVISIEGNDDNVLGAQHKDTNTLKCLQRYKLADSVRMNAPKKVNCLLQENTSISEVTQNSENHLLLGLHACGPLSTIILNQLKQSQSAKALLLVSCCYMKIDNKSFPLSQMVKRSPVPEISYQAKEVACHAIEKFVHKLQTNDNLDSLRVHCFRAILESLINKFTPDMRHKALKRVKITPQMTFRQYFYKAVNGLDIVIPEEELDSCFVKECVKHEKRVVIFYSLRLLIAPLVETLILLDFINYLKEEGIQTALFPLFDPILSPRNNVLIAMK